MYRSILRNDRCGVSRSAIKIYGRAMARSAVAFGAMAYMEQGATPEATSKMWEMEFHPAPDPL